MDRGTVNAITMSKKTREAARRGNKRGARKLDVVAEETARRTFIRRIRAGFLSHWKVRGNFDGGRLAEKCRHNENENVIGERARSAEEFRFRFKLESGRSFLFYFFFPPPSLFSLPFFFFSLTPINRFRFES